MKLSEMQEIPHNSRGAPDPNAPRGRKRVFNYHQIDAKTGEEVQVWYSLQEIDDDGEFRSQLVSNVCNGSRNEHGGFNWKKVRKDSKKG